MINRAIPHHTMFAHLHQCRRECGSLNKPKEEVLHEARDNQYKKDCCNLIVNDLTVFRIPNDQLL